MTALVGLNGGRFEVLDRGDRLRYHGFTWDSDFRDYNNDGNIYMRYSKTGSTSVVVARISGGQVGYHLGPDSAWAQRVGNVYTTLDQLNFSGT